MLITIAIVFTEMVFIILSLLSDDGVDRTFNLLQLTTCAFKNSMYLLETYPPVCNLYQLLFVMKLIEFENFFLMHL